MSLDTVKMIKFKDGRIKMPNFSLRRFYYFPPPIFTGMTNFIDRTEISYFIRPVPEIRYLDFPGRSCPIPEIGYDQFLLCCI